MRRGIIVGRGRSTSGALEITLPVRRSAPQTPPEITTRLGNYEEVMTRYNPQATSTTTEAPILPTYELTSSVSSINEGGSVTFTLTTTLVADGIIIPYIITGVSTADIGGASLTGDFTINNGTASVTFNITEDLTTEGTETMTITSAGQTASVTINDTSLSPPTYVLSSNVNSVNEGDSVTFTLTTTNVSNGTNILYIITGVTSSDIGGASLAGNFVVNNNTASITINITQDLTTEGVETLTVEAASQTVSVTINDTSVSPPTYALVSNVNSVNEGGSVTFTLTTTNVPDGSTVPYIITGVSTTDIDGASLSGNFTVNGNTANITINITADSVTEGTETMTITSAGQTVSVTINDTSVETVATFYGWYDASDESTIVKSGQSVITWLDKTPYGNNMSYNGTLAKAPTYNRTHNGLNVVNFGTQGQFLRRIGMTIPNINLTWFVVAQVDVGGVNDSADSLLSVHVPGDASRECDTWQLNSFNVNQFHGAITRCATVRKRLLYGSVDLSGEYQMFEVSFDTINNIDSIYLNGVLKASRSNTEPLNLNGAQFRMFTNRSEFAFPIGAMAEVIGMGSNTTLDRTRVEGYLAWKWGIQSKLPIDHPYKNTPYILT
jgi:hypothetical protein